MTGLSNVPKAACRRHDQLAVQAFYPGNRAATSSVLCKRCSSAKMQGGYQGACLSSPGLILKGLSKAKWTTKGLPPPAVRCSVFWRTSKSALYMLLNRWPAFRKYLRHKAMFSSTPQQAR